MAAELLQYVRTVQEDELRLIHESLSFAEISRLRRTNGDAR
jgi:hypothetical protein